MADCNGRRSSETRLRIDIVLFLFSLISLLLRVALSSTSVGYIWERPRSEQHDVETVTFKSGQFDLRLICVLSPPLPKTKENFLARDRIVQWKKIYTTHNVSLANVYWSDDQSITAMAIKNLSILDLGKYGCYYNGRGSTITVKVDNFNSSLALGKATSHLEFEHLIMNTEETFPNIPLVPQRQQKDFPSPVFDCLDIAGESSNKDIVPTSVHRLKPGSFKIIGTMGEAISAGVASKASSIADLFKTFKDASFSDGFRNHANLLSSIANIINQFNPNLITLPEDSTVTLKYDASIRDFELEGKKFYDAMVARSDLNIAEDWKLLNLFIGYNDACYACTFDEGWKEHLEQLERSIDYLYTKIPRLLVNVILPPNATALFSKVNQMKSCAHNHRKPCHCLEGNAANRRAVDAMQQDIVSHVKELIQGNRKYNQRDDFSIVVQPFLSKLSAEWNEEELSDFLADDCYHLSVRGHQLLAHHLWNNMLEPVGEKTATFSPYVHKLQCPNKESPFIYTTHSRFNPYDALSSGSLLRHHLILGMSIILAFAAIAAITKVIVMRRKQVPASFKIDVLQKPWRRTHTKLKV